MFTHPSHPSLQMGELDMAIADYSRVLEMDPEHVRAEYQRGACQNMKGDFAGAIQDYVNALEKDQGKSKAAAAARSTQQQATPQTERLGLRNDGDGEGGAEGLSTPRPAATSTRNGQTSTSAFVSPQVPHTVMARRVVAQSTPSTTVTTSTGTLPKQKQQQQYHQRPNASVTPPASSSPMPSSSSPSGPDFA